MKIFISWSGKMSHQIAVILREWIPSVIQSVEPYVSSEDIDKGARWSTDIAEELQGAKYGILCLTPDNVEAPWLNFEAGALSKTIIDNYVSPFLIGLKPSEIKGPIVQFQSTSYNLDDVKKLIHGINEANSDTKIDKERLNSYFDVWWPKLKEKLDKVEKSIKVESAKKTNPNLKEKQVEVSKSDEVLEEILALARSQQRLLKSPEEILPPRYLQEVLDIRNNALDRDSDIHPDAINDLRNGLKELEKMLKYPEEFEGTDIKSQIGKAFELLKKSSDYILDRLEYRNRRIRKW